MASDTLSQNEIDALLGGSGRAASPIALSGDQNVQVYDFRRPHRVSKERLRTLEAMYERLVKSLEGWLIGRVRGQVEMRLQSVEQFSFGEFTLSLPTPCASYMVDIRNSGGQQGVIDFGHEFAYFLVDRLFGGGAGSAPTIMQRSLTPIERMAVRQVAERVNSLVVEIWQDHVELDLNLTGFESFPEIMQAVDKDEPVLVANLEVSAAGLSSLVLICLPFSVLDKFFSASGQKRINTMTGTEREKDAARERAEGSLRATRVSVAARLPAFPLTLRELSALEPGSVLSTGIPRDCQLQVLVGEQERFRGSAGRVGRRLAVRLLDSISPPNGLSSDDTEEPIA
jgi:flagellar motor switch protein FliM